MGETIAFLLRSVSIIAFDRGTYLPDGNQGHERYMGITYL